MFVIEIRKDFQFQLVVVHPGFADRAFDRLIQEFRLPGGGLDTPHPDSIVLWKGRAVSATWNSDTDEILVAS